MNNLHFHFDIAELLHALTEPYDRPIEADETRQPFERNARRVAWPGTSTRGDPSRHRSGSRSTTRASRVARTRADLRSHSRCTWWHARTCERAEPSPTFRRRATPRSSGILNR